MHSTPLAVASVHLGEHVMVFVAMEKVDGASNVVTVIVSLANQCPVSITSNGIRVIERSSAENNGRHPKWILFELVELGSLAMFDMLKSNSRAWARLSVSRKQRQDPISYHGWQAKSPPYDIDMKSSLLNMSQK